MIRALSIITLVLTAPTFGLAQSAVADRATADTGGLTMNQGDDPIWLAFDLRDLAASRAESDRPWLPFLDVSTMNAGVYVLPVGGQDEQRPHELDELYYVVSGRATLEVAGDQQEVGPGSLVYVKARAPHHFHSIKEELQVLVFFSKKERAQ